MIAVEPPGWRGDGEARRRRRIEPEFPSNFEPLRGIEPRTYGLRNARRGQEHRQVSGIADASATSTTPATPFSRRNWHRSGTAIGAVLVACLASAGCSARGARVVDVSTLLVSNVMLVADARYTATVARESWSGGREEIGIPARPILGAMPSSTAVETYFASAVILNTALWFVLPPRWRSVLPGVVIAAQADALAYNYVGCNWCP